MKRNKIKSESKQKRQPGSMSKYAEKCKLYGYGKSMIQRRSITLDNGKSINVPVDYGKKIEDLDS